MLQIHCSLQEVSRTGGVRRKSRGGVKRTNQMSVREEESKARGQLWYLPGLCRQVETKDE